MSQKRRFFEKVVGLELWGQADPFSGRSVDISKIWLAVFSQAGVGSKEVAGTASFLGL
jgi:hypothetical protein